jgi:hypothetical protein
MAETEWTALDNGLDAASVVRGVTHGIARPNGGGSFCYGWNSKVTAQGVAGLFCNEVDYSPMAKGGSVRGAVQRGVSGGPLNFAPMLFIGLQGTDVSDDGYLLGLSDESPHRIVLRKGKPSGGIPAGAVTVPPTAGILRRSVETFDPGTWLHLRLDMIVNPSGDTILQVFRNDLDAHDVTDPVWQPVAGMTEVIDDALGVNTWSPPLANGRAGFAFFTKDVTRRGYVDHIEVLRQINP